MNDPKAGFRGFERRALAGERLDVVFFGASLTWGANATDPQTTSYRARVADRLREAYPKAPFRFWDAAIGGTGSQLGVFRLDRDALRRKPDLAFLDFTANDDIRGDDEERLASYEALVRRLTLECPVVQVAFPFKPDAEAPDLAPMRRLHAHRRIAEAYGAGFGDAVGLIQLRIAQGETTADALWPYDGGHPCDEGYELFAEAAWNGFREAVLKPLSPPGERGRGEGRPVISDVSEGGRPLTPSPSPPEGRGEPGVFTLPEMLYADTYLTSARVRLSGLGPLPEGWRVDGPNLSAAFYDMLMSRWLDDEVVATWTSPLPSLEGLGVRGESLSDPSPLPLSPGGERGSEPAPLRLRFRGTMALLFGESTPKSCRFRVVVDGVSQEFDAGWLGVPARGNGHLSFVVAQGLDPDREHTLEIVPLIEPGSDAELRIESLCVAGKGAAVFSEPLSPLGERGRGEGREPFGPLTPTLSPGGEREPEGYLPTALPTPRQLEYQDWEYGLFLHFGIRTFYEGHRDWDGQAMEASAFDPTELDCDGWAQTAVQAGMKYAVLTAKHHDGFALWPSRYTDFSVAASPWREGLGDVVREYVDACRRHGLKVGLYYSPADASKTTYADPKAYDDYFISQVSELLTGYGEIDILWFDGCGSEGHVYDWTRITGEIRRLQPNILIFELGDPDFRWAGNEAGIAPRPLWNTVDRVEFTVNALEKVGLPEGPRWLPAECDFRMRAVNWFYSDADEATVKSLPELLGLYYLSVGRGANMLINVGPDRRGKLPEADRLRLLELREEIQRRFAHPLATLDAATTEDGIEWRFPEAVLLNHVVMQEDLTSGEHIRRFAIEIQPFPAGERVVVYEGRNVGHKAICAFPAVKTLSVTVRIVEATGEGRLRAAELHDTTQTR